MTVALMTRELRAPAHVTRTIRIVRINTPLPPRPAIAQPRRRALRR